MWDGGGAGGMHGAGSTLNTRGHGTRGERTLNMSFMSVTLDVSKLSGWLNADMDCAESKGGHAMRDEVRAGSSREGIRSYARCWTDGGG